MAANPIDPQTLNAILEEHQGRLAVEHLEPQGTAYLATLRIRAVSTEVLPRELLATIDRLIRGPARV